MTAVTVKCLSVDCWLHWDFCTSKQLWDLLGFTSVRQQSSFRQQQEELLTKSFLSSRVIWRASDQRRRQNKMLAGHVSANQNAVRVGTSVSHHVHIKSFYDLTFIPGGAEDCQASDHSLWVWHHMTFSRKHRGKFPAVFLTTKRLY